MSIQCQITAIDSGSLSHENTGLGNVLFQLATGYGFSKRTGCYHNCQQLDIYTKKLMSLFGYNHRGTIFRSFDFNRSWSPNTLLTEQNHCFALYDSQIVAQVSNLVGRDIQINGYVQSHLYFHAYRNELLHIFSIDIDTRDAIIEKYSCLTDTTKTCISLHFRTNWGHGITYCLDYYKEAIRWFKENTQNPHFLIFADNIDVVRGFLPELAIESTILEGNLDYIDLWAMTLCKHNVLSFSTFSWWGAYLNPHNDRKVFFPYDAMRVSYGIHSVPVLTERLTQHYLPEWTPLYSKSIQ